MPEISVIIPAFREEQAIAKVVREVGLVMAELQQASETSFHRNIANKFYNLLASYICKRKICDLTSGFRAVRSHVARQFVSMLPNTFSYPTTLTTAIVRAGFSLTYVPVKAARGSGKSKIRLLQDGSGFLLIIIKIATLFSPLRVFLPVSMLMFLTGLGWVCSRYFSWAGATAPPRPCS